MGEPIAAVDLGSNSFHMIVARLDNGRMQIIDKLRERVRLGAGLDAESNLRPEAFDRALACLERFGQRVRELERGRVRAVGTNTLRKAKNGVEFVTQAQNALGHPIDIIAGREEARLIYLGVAQSVSHDTGRRLVVDIGGGSTECIIGDGFDIVDADSLFMGCVSFSRKYFVDGIIDAEHFTHAEIGAQLELQAIVGPYKKHGWQTAIGCSGTIHAIKAILLANGWSRGGINRKGLKRLKKALISAGHIDAVVLPGLERDRKPVIAGGTAILKAIFDSFGIEEMMPSPGALREGALYDLLGRIRHEDVRDRTIGWFQERYGVDTRHSEQVELTALRLLENAAPDWGIDPDRAGRHLTWAARLHEIGAAISHTGRHKHGAYIVEHSDMAGFSRFEQRLLASLILGQRRKLRPEHFSHLPPNQRLYASQLCVLFRLAVVLNRNRSSRSVGATRIAVKKKSLKLEVGGDWLEAHPLTQEDLLRQADYLSALDYTLDIIPT